MRYSIKRKRTDMNNLELEIKCTGCKKKFHASGFKNNRLGHRLKTCLECNGRRSAHVQRREERKINDLIDHAHGAICKRNPDRVNEQARAYGVKLVDDLSYKNIRTPVEWECFAHQHRFVCQRQNVKMGCLQCYRMNNPAVEA